MKAQAWPLQEPVDAIIFDCDGTLSSIEGIDELAQHNHVGDIVQRMTQEAMGNHGMSPEIYEKRLNLVKPTRAQVMALGSAYIQHCVPDAQEVIRILLRLKKTVYIISAGLLPAVAWFGNYLLIPEKNIYAVAIQFDDQGHYLDFDHTSPMTRQYGKRDIIQQLPISRSAYVGDGLSDLEVYDCVSRFIGYGGAYYRKNIEKQCEFYLKSASLAPMLPLVLTADEYAQLTHEEQIFCDAR